MCLKSALAALALGPGCLYLCEARAARIIVVGDSWAEPIGIQLISVLDENGHADWDVLTTPYWGGPRNLDSPEGRAEISRWLNQWPDANYIYFQMGQNNWLCCWTPDMAGTADEAELFESIIDHMDNVVEYVLSIRPGATLWWTAGEYFRPHPKGSPAEMNASHDLLAGLAFELASRHESLSFYDWNGLFQTHYGFDGVPYTEYDPDFVIPPGDPSLPDASLPSPYAAYPEQRPAHPHPQAYKVMAQALYERFIVPEIAAELVQWDWRLNGNWWGGFARSGEGAQIDVSDAGGGERVLVATVYSYDTLGDQIFLVAVGPITGAAVNVDVFITEGGTWGESFEPGRVTESQWGSGSFTLVDCDRVNMSLVPNGSHQALGYTALSYDLIRLTVPMVNCDGAAAE